MNLFGTHDSEAWGDGYVYGAWDEVRDAMLEGHISHEAYDVLHAAIHQTQQKPGERETPRTHTDTWTERLHAVLTVLSTGGMSLLTRPKQRNSRP